MHETNYRPSGELQGDDKPMPDRGTGTNVTDTYGADISLTARNRKGRMGDCTASDPAEMEKSAQPDNI